MDPKTWKRVEEIFLVAADLTEPQQRSFLEGSCEGDPELLAAVERMLTADRGTGDKVSKALSDGVDLLGRGESRGGRIGPWRILDRIAQGGMGVVYLAERADREFDKKVAIKLIRSGMDTRAIVGRFRRERQILASLEHPNIAHLLDGGTTAEGLPYFVMEHVEGEPIDLYCDRRRLSVRSRLGLFLTVCEAIEHAHQNLIVHRDLKPGNILVTDEGTVKLLDFGIAKLLARDGTEVAEPELTAPGEKALTPSFASPEQVRGERVTTASDVYSLGVILYRLLSGRRPYLLKGLTAKEVEERILEYGPLAPSTALRESPEEETTTAAELARARSTQPQQLARVLQGDLDNVVMKALAKERRARYPSVDQLAQDIRRHLAGQPVLARRPTFGYRAGKFLRRNAVWVGVAAAFLAVIAASGVSLTAQWRRAEAERDTSLRLVEFLQELFADADPDATGGEELTARQMLDRGATRIRDLEREPEMQSRLQQTLAEIYLTNGELDHARSLAEQALEIRLELFGPEHEDVARSLALMGHVAHEAGAPVEAEGHYRSALEIFRRRLGPETLEVAETTNDLANPLLAQSRFEEAEELYRESIRLLEEILGPEHEIVAVALSNLGLVFKGLGRLGEAEGLLRRAVEISRATLGSPHSELAQQLENLGAVLQDQGSLEEARQLYEECRAMREELFDTDHPELLAGLSNLAALYSDMGNHREARDIFADLVEREHELFKGRPHWRVGIRLTNLAGTELSLGDFREAESNARAAIEEFERSDSRDRAEYQGAHLNLAHSLRLLGEAGEAEGLYRKVLAWQIEELGPEHWRVGLTSLNLGQAVHAQGRLGEARELLGMARDRLVVSLSDAHPITLDALSLLALAESDLGRTREAEEKLERAVRKLREAGDPLLVRSLARYGQVLIAAGRAEEAVELLREALGLQLEEAGETFWRTGLIQSLLGRSLALQGERDEAGRLLRQGLEALHLRNGPDYYQTRRAWSWLQAYLAEAGDREALAELEKRYP